MRFFIDTGSVAEVQELAAWGVLSGATTNPSLLALEAADPEELIRSICAAVDGPVSAEVVAADPSEMVAQGHGLHALHEHVVVKVPFGAAGLAATRQLRRDGIPVNVTLVFSATQALLAAEAGASYVSCFMGRLDDVGIDSSAVLGEIAECLAPATAGSSDRAHLLAASIRHPGHVVAAARLGAPVATVPAKVLRQMLEHPLTDAGVARFLRDWEARPELASWLAEVGRRRRPGALALAAR